MRIHILQHVYFEHPAYLLTWVKNRGMIMTDTQMYRSFSLPPPNDFDALIIMGGPMGVYDEDRYPWLKEEKRYIMKFIQTGKPVLGICLGAQLIAEVLGAKVYKNSHPEIGWFPIQLTSPGKAHPLFQNFPETLTAFHWHNDTFDIPYGAIHLVESNSCKNQAFLYDHHVLALQFHLESTTESIQQLIQYGSDDLMPGSFIQSAEEISSLTQRNEQSLWTYCNMLMDRWIALNAQKN